MGLRDTQSPRQESWLLYTVGFLTRSFLLYLRVPTSASNSPCCGSMPGKDNYAIDRSNRDTESQHSAAAEILLAPGERKRGIAGHTPLSLTHINALYTGASEIAISRPLSPTISLQCPHTHPFKRDRTSITQTIAPHPGEEERLIILELELSPVTREDIEAPEPLPLQLVVLGGVLGARRPGRLQR